MPQLGMLATRRRSPAFVTSPVVAEPQWQLGGGCDGTRTRYIRGRDVACPSRLGSGQ